MNEVNETTEPKKEKNPLKAIRKKCYNCSNFSWREVDLCAHQDCELFEFRYGKNPYRVERKLSDAQKAQLKENLKRAREAKQAKQEVQPPMQ